MKIKKISGFTLNEMLITLIIIGILAGLSVPKLYPLITKAKAKEAELQLKYIATLQEQYSYMNSTFSNSLETIDFIAPRTVKDGGTSNYSYEIIEASAASGPGRRPWSILTVMGCSTFGRCHRRANP